ncbi:TerD family protein [Rhodococcus marinonascens]|uniref:TerD family protein n=1 Tax=Rhodococcus marinonascens TaxID=38311 RepID=UPI000934DC3A|nr:Tellurium resistance [Rhodococcus marinonascens]
MAINLNKVTLDKSTPTVSLAKSGDGQGTMRVNLNWTARAATPDKGFLAKLKAAATPGIDLDLGAMYELADGTKGVVQALGNSFGALNEPPFIYLDGDDRSGGNTAGENLHINLADITKFRRILIFAFIYQGVPNWSQANGVVTLFPTSGPQVEVELDSADNQALSCAIAMLESNGRELTVTREVRYIRGGQQEIDQAYGFGMEWTAGSK